MIQQEVYDLIRSIVYNDEPKKITVFYHKDCTDGFMAALAAFFSLSPSNQISSFFIPIQYGEIREDNTEVLSAYKDSDITFILDFSFPKSVLETLDKEFKGPVVLIDHHESLFRTFGLTTDFKGIVKTFNKTYLCLDNDRSGALLTWDYFYTQQGKHKWFNGIPEIPCSVLYTDDGDRWVFNYKDDTHHFRAGMTSKMSDWKINFTWTDIFYSGENIFKRVMAEGKVLHEAFKNDVKIVLKDKYSFVLNGYNVLSVNCSEKFRSEVGNQLAEESPSYIGVTWVYSGKTRYVKVSLRSIGDVNVGLIAESFGGGGHKNAAGFEIDLQQWLKLHEAKTNGA